jgi:hypothetical protein
MSLSHLRVSKCWSRDRDVTFGPYSRCVTTRINTATISSRLFFLLTTPMKLEKNVPKRRYIKFSHRGITQKKECNMIK